MKYFEITSLKNAGFVKTWSGAQALNLRVCITQTIREADLDGN